MEPTRWIRALVPLAAIALMGGGMLTRPPILAASDPPWVPPPCPDPGSPGAPGAGSWYRLDGVLDETGTLAGQRLSIGMADGSTRRIGLPAESFATGPVNGLVLVGADDGTRSRLSVVDTARACATVVADEPSVVRSALMTADGTGIVEHRVARATREDQGDWHRPLSGGRATRQLPGLAFDARYGPTFATELRFAPDGSLAVSSCGELACRTRLAKGGDGRVTTIGPTGQVLGVVGDGSVVAYGPCGGFPCRILGHDRRGGLRMLVPTAGRAAMHGDRLVYEDEGPSLRVLDLVTGDTAPVDAPDGVVPIRDGSRATSGAAGSATGVLLAPDGRVDGSPGAVLLPGDAAPLGTTEVIR